MPSYIAYATFPGVSKIVGATATMGHGVTPSVMQLELAPQQSFSAAGGTFSIIFSNIPDGGSDTIQYDWPDCKVLKHSFNRDSGGEKWTLQIVDRRWKWALGRVSGVYNIRDEEGELIEDREKPAREIIELCLMGMGEDVEGNPSGYILDDIPDARPKVEWDAEDAADALAEICDALGLRVVLQLDNRVAIRKAGEGNQLPSTITYPIVENSLSINPPERPDKVELVAGATRHQVDIPLEAIGYDPMDEEIKLIDDLSYKPDDGWGSVFPPHFHGIKDPEKNETYAKSWVFRAYRLKIGEDDPLEVAGWSTDEGEGDPITNIKQVLPIFDKMVETEKDDPEKRKEPIVFGRFWPGTDSGKNTIKKDDVDPSAVEDADPTIVVDSDFSVDKKKGIIKFRDHVYANTEGDTDNEPVEFITGEPDLWLRISVPVRDPDTWGVNRYTKDKEVEVNGEPANFGTQPKTIRHFEIEQTFTPIYSSGSFNIEDVETNEADIEEEVDHYIDAEIANLSPAEPQTIQYANILPGLELDGAISQITFSTGSHGDNNCGVTTISRNDDQTDFTISYKERRRLERTSQALKQQILNRPDVLAATIELLRKGE